MLTDQLFETWNIDTEMLVRAARSVAPDGDVLFGGSLADDLGTVLSDIDLYHFSPGPAAATSTPRVLKLGEVFIELHSVDVDAPGDALPDLRHLLLSDCSAAAENLPLISGRTMRMLYALYCDRRLSGDGKAAESLRRRTGADLLHVHVTLRSVLTATALVDDVRTLNTPEHRYTCLYCARLLAEAALDALLATRGLMHPNPKWRLMLAERAAIGWAAFPRVPELLPALFPHVDDPVEAVAYCVRMARTCLEVVNTDGLLASFPIVPEALAAVAGAAAVEGASA